MGWGGGGGILLCLLVHIGLSGLLPSFNNDDQHWCQVHHFLQHIHDVRVALGPVNELLQGQLTCGVKGRDKKQGFLDFQDFTASV